MSLPSPFSGVPASVGTRLAAFSIDVVLVSIVTVAAALLFSPALGVALAAEALLGLWILQARLGVSPGAAMLGLRVARDDAPFSPGAGRTFVRGSLVLAGALALFAGAWVVVASAAWDRTGRRRAWIDKAAETVVVAVPAGRGGGDTYALASPTVMGRSSAAGRGGAPRAVDGALAPSELPVAPAWGAQVVAPPPPPASATTGGAAPHPEVPQPVSVVPLTGAAPAAPSTPARPAPAGAQLLIVFDTGQRVQFALPTAVNLGRNPAATAPGDAVVVVDDPDRMVSKTHLRLEHDGETAWVTDAGSTNGSELVDEDGVGRVLAAGVRTVLDDGMRVRLGERVFTVSRLIGGPV